MTSAVRTLLLLATAAALARCSGDRTDESVDGVSGAEDVTVSSDLASCPLITSVSTLPGETALGTRVALEATLSRSAAVRWTGTGGTIAEPSLLATWFRCERAGTHVLTVRLVGVAAVCEDAARVEVTCTPRE